MNATLLKGSSVEIHLLDIVFPKWLQKYSLPPMLFCEEDFYVHLKRQSPSALPINPWGWHLL